jgi:hypothetical protein
MRNIAVIKMKLLFQIRWLAAEQAIGYPGPYIELSMEQDGYRQEEQVFVRPVERGLRPCRQGPGITNERGIYECRYYCPASLQTTS